ncbi:MAG TPA: hypothetical protein VG028_00200 [Terriglobia bacterium]|nr:hypothetical protein [Terriglobia bacterium]
MADPLNVTFEEAFKKHDEQVIKVESCAARFFDGLMQTEPFRTQVAKSLEEYEAKLSSDDPQYPKLESFRGEIPKMVAEYLINRTEVLPQHYMTYKFWEHYRSQFGKFLKDEFEPYRERTSFQTLAVAVKTLHDDSSKLLADLINHRQMLCSTYDIPAAPVPLDRGNPIDALFS